MQALRKGAEQAVPHTATPALMRRGLIDVYINFHMRVQRRQTSKVSCLDASMACSTPEDSKLSNLPLTSAMLGRASGSWAKQLLIRSLRADGRPVGNGCL